MERNNLLKALDQLKVQTGSLPCLGCYHEHSCGTRGCAIIREAVRQLERQRFHPPQEAPEGCGDVLICFSGRYRGIRFNRAIEMGSFENGDWSLNEYPFCKDVIIHGWWYPPEDPEGSADE